MLALLHRVLRLVVEKCSGNARTFLTDLNSVLGAHKISNQRKVLLTKPTLTMFTGLGSRIQFDEYSLNVVATNAADVCPLWSFDQWPNITKVPLAKGTVPFLGSL
jgi:hypothetical protein